MVLRKILTGTTVFFLWIIVSPSFWPARYSVAYTSGQYKIPGTTEWLTWLLSPNNVGRSFRSYLETTHPEITIRYIAAFIVSALIAILVDPAKVYMKTRMYISRKKIERSIKKGERKIRESETQSEFSAKAPRWVANSDHRTVSVASDVVLANSDNSTVSIETEYRNVSEKSGQPAKEQSTVETIAPQIEVPYSMVVFKSVTPFEGAGEKTVVIKKFSSLVNKKIPRTMVAIDKLASVRSVLEFEYPWLLPLTSIAMDAMEVQCRIKMESVPMEVPSILVLGPPGIGKTDWCRRFSELFGNAHRILTLGGKQSSATIRSSERVWSTAGPSALISTILQENTANPLIVLDEIDKVGSGDANGNVQDTLLQLTEKSSSKNVYDDFLEGVVDLSGIQWLATANRQEDISEPLCNRFRIVTVGCPEPKYARSISLSVKKRIASEWNIKERDLPEIDAEATVHKLLESGKSLRDIHRSIVDLYSKIIKSA